MGEFDLDMPTSFGFGHSSKHTSKLSALTWFLFISAIWVFIMGAGIFVYHDGQGISTSTKNFFLAVAIIGFIIAFVIIVMFFTALYRRQTFFEVAHNWATSLNFDNVGRAESQHISDGMEMTNLLNEYQ